MNKETVILTFNVYWQFKDFNYLKVTKCKKIVDTKRGVLLKYGVRGFFIKGKYYKRSELNRLLEPIKNPRLRGFSHL